MKDESISITASIIAITIIGSVYLLMGHNSVGFTAMIAVLAGIGGYMIPSPIGKKK